MMAQAPAVENSRDARQCREEVVLAELDETAVPTDELEENTSLQLVPGYLETREVQAIQAGAHELVHEQRAGPKHPPTKVKVVGTSTTTTFRSCSC